MNRTQIKTHNAILLESEISKMNLLRIQIMSPVQVETAANLILFSITELSEVIQRKNLPSAEAAIILTICEICKRGDWKSFDALIDRIFKE
ncbi:MAG: hypothetical protein ACXVCY_12815 [Pseudobdellovibrionaceae bacterium]